MPGIEDDATEVLPALTDPKPADTFELTDDDATVVLPPRAFDQMNQAAPGPQGQDADETTVLPPRPSSAPDSYAQGRFDSGQQASPEDATRPLSSVQVPPSASEELKAKLQAGAASSFSAAKSGLAAASAKASVKAKETAERVKKERAARAAGKAQAKAAQQPQQSAPYKVPSSPAPYSQPSGFPGGPSYPAQAHSGEGSPSGRLQMLTPSHIRQTRPSLWTLIQHFSAGGTLFILLVMAFVFFITTPTGQQLDEVSFQEFSYRFMTYTEQTSSLLDMIPAAAGVIAGIGLLFVLIWKHRFVPALVGLGMAIGANLTTQLLKNYFIIKPNLGIQEALGNSAPSGHTTFAAAAGLALFLASPKRFRPTVALLSMVFTVAAGYSTVVNGWHRPADVVTAILVTGLWGVLGLIILRFMRSEELDMSNTQRSGLILVPLLSISGFFIGFCAFALYWVTYTNPIPGSAFVAAICLIAAVASLTTSILIALLRPQNKQRSAYRRVWAY
ncbi:phosphatase PAP2 family protein [Rothia nasimurium]|uniref:phosphatase PAP2 family protein n=1 Tax=Rothia nasimurium TaxID=85336 RepID=UPI003BA186D4